MDEDAQKGIWKLITKKVPEEVLLIVIVYVGIVVGGGWLYNTLTANNQLDAEYIKIVTYIFLLMLAIFTTIMGVRIGYVLKNKKIKLSETLPEGKIDAFIVEQDARSRDDKFNDINANVQKTYWVLGVSLTSMVDRETMLKKMAQKNIHTKLCMMNPDITVENLCISSVNNETCNLSYLAEKIKSGQMKKEDITLEFKKMNNCKDMLEIYHVLINAIHFNQYYMTDTDYTNRIKDSYKNLKRIRSTITKEHGYDSFELKVADSFMPMSLTIADAEEECGRLVVEFHLPFTQYKVLFEISKKNNGELFDVFVDFYKTVWNRASESK